MHRPTRELGEGTKLTPQVSRRGLNSAATYGGFKVAIVVRRSFDNGILEPLS